MKFTVDTVIQFDQSHCIRSQTLYERHRLISESVGLDREYLNLKYQDCCVQKTYFDVIDTWMFCW